MLTTTTAAEEEEAATFLPNMSGAAAASTRTALTVRTEAVSTEAVVGRLLRNGIGETATAAAAESHPTRTTEVGTGGQVMGRTGEVGAGPTAEVAAGVHLRRPDGEHLTSAILRTTNRAEQAVEATADITIVATTPRPSAVLPSARVNSRTVASTTAGGATDGGAEEEEDQGRRTAAGRSASPRNTAATPPVASPTEATRPGPTHPRHTAGGATAVPPLTPTRTSAIAVPRPTAVIAQEEEEVEEENTEAAGGRRSPRIRRRIPFKIPAITIAVLAARAGTAVAAEGGWWWETSVRRKSAYLRSEGT